MPTGMETAIVGEVGPMKAASLGCCRCGGREPEDVIGEGAAATGGREGRSHRRKGGGSGHRQKVAATASMGR
jgi:hypothetical protein